MADLLVPDIDDRLMARLESMARLRGIPLNALAVELLSTAASATQQDALVAEIAAMRASQPWQGEAAVADVRALRDGETPVDTVNRAAR